MLIYLTHAFVATNNHAILPQCMSFTNLSLDFFFYKFYTISNSRCLCPLFIIYLLFEEGVSPPYILDFLLQPLNWFLKKNVVCSMW
jgi:hypothetical protein